MSSSLGIVCTSLRSVGTWEFHAAEVEGWKARILRFEITSLGFGFMVSGFGFVVSGLGFRAEGFGFLDLEV